MSSAGSSPIDDSWIFDTIKEDPPLVKPTQPRMNSNGSSSTIEAAIPLPSKEQLRGRCTNISSESIKMYASNMAKLIGTARKRISELESENKDLQQSCNGSRTVKCPSCSHMFKDKECQVYPRYIKVFRGKFTLEIEFNDQDHLSQWLSANRLEKDSSGMTTLIRKETDDVNLNTVNSLLPRLVGNLGRHTLQNPKGYFDDVEEMGAIVASCSIASKNAVPGCNQEPSVSERVPSLLSFMNAELPARGSRSKSRDYSEQGTASFASGFEYSESRDHHSKNSRLRGRDAIDVRKRDRDAIGTRKRDRYAMENKMPKSIDKKLPELESVISERGSNESQNRSSSIRHSIDTKKRGRDSSDNKMLESIDKKLPELGYINPERGKIVRRSNQSKISGPCAVEKHHDSSKRRDDSPVSRTNERVNVRRSPRKSTSKSRSENSVVVHGSSSQYVDVSDKLGLSRSKHADDRKTHHRRSDQVRISNKDKTVASYISTPGCSKDTKDSPSDSNKVDPDRNSNRRTYKTRKYDRTPERRESLQHGKEHRNHRKPDREKIEQFNKEDRFRNSNDGKSIGSSISRKSDERNANKVVLPSSDKKSVPEPKDKNVNVSSIFDPCLPSGAGPTRKSPIRRPCMTISLPLNQSEVEEGEITDSNNDSSDEIYASSKKDKHAMNELSASYTLEKEERQSKAQTIAKKLEKLEDKTEIADVASSNVTGAINSVFPDVQTQEELRLRENEISDSDMVTDDEVSSSTNDPAMDSSIRFEVQHSEEIPSMNAPNANEKESPSKTSNVLSSAKDKETPKRILADSSPVVSPPKRRLRRIEPDNAEEVTSSNAADAKDERIPSIISDPKSPVIALKTTQRTPVMSSPTTSTTKISSTRRRESHSNADLSSINVFNANDDGIPSSASYQQAPITVLRTPQRTSAASSTVPSTSKRKSIGRACKNRSVEPSPTKSRKKCISSKPKECSIETMDVEEEFIILSSPSSSSTEDSEEEFVPPQPTRKRIRRSCQSPTPVVDNRVQPFSTKRTDRRTSRRLQKGRSNKKTVSRDFVPVIDPEEDSRQADMLAAELTPVPDLAELTLLCRAPLQELRSPENTPGSARRKLEGNTPYKASPASSVKEKVTADCPTALTVSNVTVQNFASDHNLSQWSGGSSRKTSWQGIRTSPPLRTDGSVSDLLNLSSSDGDADDEEDVDVVVTEKPQCSMHDASCSVPEHEKSDTIDMKLADSAVILPNNRTKGIAKMTSTSTANAMQTPVAVRIYNTEMSSMWSEPGMTGSAQKEVIRSLDRPKKSPEHCLENSTNDNASSSNVVDFASERVGYEINESSVDSENDELQTTVLEVPAAATAQETRARELEYSGSCSEDSVDDVTNDEEVENEGDSADFDAEDFCEFGVVVTDDDAVWDTNYEGEDSEGDADEKEEHI